MREDSPTLWNLRMAIREGQDAGDLPCESMPGRRFQVMANEIAAPILSSMVKPTNQRLHKPGQFPTRAWIAIHRYDWYTL